MRKSLKELLLVTVLAVFATTAFTRPLAAQDASASCPQDEEKEETVGDKLDRGFGTYIVTPTFLVLFWDVMFWDNRLPRSEAKATGQVVTIEGSDSSKPEGEQDFSFSAKVVGYDGSHFIVQKQVEAPESAVTRPVTETEPDEGMDDGSDEEGMDEEGEDAPEPDTEPIQVGDTVVYQGTQYTVIEISKSAELKSVKTHDVEVDPKFDVQECFPIGSVQPEGIVIGHTKGAYTVRTVSHAPLKKIARAQVKKRKAELGAEVVYQGAKQEITRVDNVLLLQSDAKTTIVSGPTVTYNERPANPKENNLPLVVLWLVLGAIFFTLRFGFINVRAFLHAIAVTAGRFDDPDDPGEVNHFKALSSALSATVGLGNIAGVALAVAAGGPGAVFWMIIAGFLGMSSKFVECTLAQVYRRIDENGVVLGGPMRYLADGLQERGIGWLGKVLAVVFAVMCIGGSLGGGNMFQANQAFAQLQGNIPGFPSWLFGILLAICVGMVIIGGIKRIGTAASMIVPLMCGIYLIAGIGVLIANASEIPTAFGTIIAEAFTMKAGFGALIGIIVTGFRRAAFSNEAGIGSAAIAHSAASTKEPVREGIVASLGPFIDTIVVCTMTGLVVVVTRAYLQDVGNGVTMTSAAFESVFGWFPYVLTFAVIMFAFSTMISWSYYGERCWTFLFGKGTSMVYRIIFVAAAFFGSIFSLGSVLDFSDLMVLGMAFPNILGVVLLSKKVKELLDDYWTRYKSGTMQQHGSAPAAEAETA